MKRLPHRNTFLRKLIKNIALSVSFLIFSLSIGVIGYHHFFFLTWVDSLYNASLILTGMGPVDPAPTDAAKIFASFYSIYSGVAFLTSVAVIFSPVIHRFLHKFRLDMED